MDVHDQVLTAPGAVCYHCGDPVRSDGVTADGRAFCCAGCRTVYDILRRNNLCEYYDFDQSPGRAPVAENNPRFAWLDQPEIAAQLKEFSDGTTAAASFVIPGMHCASCVWLLENLHRIEPAIIRSRVDFLKKRITIRWNESGATLRSIVDLLASLGYEPQITLASAERREEPKDRSLYYRVGVAGFGFANIMMLSFPEYLSGGGIDGDLARVFPLLSLLLALPVFFYSAWVYFRSAWQGLRRGLVNIDVPLALGILVLFGRSVYEILSGTGPGFLDSMAGLVFFLLVGKLFQDRTYDSLNFERTYTSYFPLAVMVREKGGERAVPVKDLKIGERMLVRHGEIIPADAVLVRGSAAIDYSFVTGEAEPVERRTGDMLFAGGRQTGGIIEADVVREVSQSYLTQLWNDAGARANERRGLTAVSNNVARWFTAVVLLLALGAAAYWFPRDVRTAVNAVTGILIVACPCALALATPFTYGTAQRIFGRNGLYLKNASVVESMAKADTLVFDKTGTLTETQGRKAAFVGPPLNDREKEVVVSLAAGSHHPLSRAVSAALEGSRKHPVEGFREVPHAGIAGTVAGEPASLGSARFAGLSGDPDQAGESRVYLTLGGSVRGYFTVSTRYRSGVRELFARLARRYRLAVVSGDTERERERLEEVVADAVPLHFRHSPADKRDHVAALQAEGRVVLMVGDGLNDAGALRRADVGIAVTEDAAAFSPASDGILDGSRLTLLDPILRLSRTAVRVVLASFAVSLLYNVAVLTVAFRGGLSPLLAAVLMPLSSVTVVLLSTGSLRWLAGRKGLL